MSDKTTHARAFLTRLIEAYETVALYEMELARDKTRPKDERIRSHGAAALARARLKELEKELRDER